MTLVVFDCGLDLWGFGHLLQTTLGTDTQAGGNHAFRFCQGSSTARFYTEITRSKAEFLC